MPQPPGRHGQGRAPSLYSRDHEVASLVRRTAVDNTIIATFTDHRQHRFAVNWAAHLQGAHVGGVLVGLMLMRQGTAQYQRAERELRMRGAAVYPVLSVMAARNPQGGRWFSVLPLLMTGVRVVLSDVDIVWLRDPRPYLKRLELAHPRMDFAVSTDAQGSTDGRRLPGSTDLDCEAYRACHESMNIGLMAFPPGARTGSLRAVREMVAHLALPANLRRVDQGPVNYRWKYGADNWRWPRQLHAVGDDGGRKGRLCGLVNGSVVAAVLPIAQFGNLLTNDLLRLAPRAHPNLTAFSVHATWARSQHVDFKLARLREGGRFIDAPEYYRGDEPEHGGGGGRDGADGHGDARGAGRRDGGGRGGGGGRFLSYTPHVPASLLQRIERSSFGRLLLPSPVGHILQRRQ